jgi:hypothetical protein
MPTARTFGTRSRARSSYLRLYLRYSCTVMHPSYCAATITLSVAHNDLLGLRIEPTKHHPAAVNNVFLGVTCDVSHPGEAVPYVECRPSPHRVDNIPSMMDFGSRWGLPSHAASVLYDTLSFL